jgi:hypothetical protein
LNKKDAVLYLAQSKRRKYSPSYLKLLEIKIEVECLESLDIEYLELDGFKAVHINVNELELFNNCVKFVL